MAIRKAAINKNPNGGVLPDRGFKRTSFASRVLPKAFDWAVTGSQSVAFEATTVEDLFDHTATTERTVISTKTVQISESNHSSISFDGPAGSTYFDGVITFPDSREESTAVITIGSPLNAVTRTIQTPFTISQSIVGIPKANSLALETFASLDQAGSTDFYSSTNPYVREQNNICPGVDLTCIAAAGRGILIAPDLVWRAFHNRGSIGDNHTFVGNDGSVYASATSSISQKFGGDGVLVQLATPLPSEIKPALLPPNDFHEYFSDAISGETIGYKAEFREGATNALAISQHRIGAGSFRLTGIGTSNPLFDVNRRFDIREDIWDEGTTGDSGGANFVVIEGQVVAMGATWNTAEQATLIHPYLDEIFALTNDAQMIDLSNYPKGS